ncbi:exo-beta-1,3-glucanase [Gymnopus androsaceus JB14]|uniref:Exo-beta-1,3-glucanase n=1 Tax=Gymnopus androsaceus JB14 TaxID=1447944 RepID=A0A6A4H186_9AGAR|nr:exo-beta-1,3-glucanase [Gymnopus androsaceus JB14]
MLPNPLGPGEAPAETPYWRELIKHQGTAPFNPNATYSVYRNVKDYGAIGDGIADDSAAINLAISDGGRCGGGGCESSTITPAVVYFPSGTYLVKKAITPYYMTQLLGDPRDPPTLLADESFRDMAVIDADPYIAGGQWFVNQNNFYRTVKNFIIDVRRVPASVSQGTGIHWQVAQATNLQNIVFRMSEDPDTAHQGIWMENGSGGFMGDLVFYGGKFGMWVGNQQFTVRNVTMNNCQSAVFGLWAWGWTFQGITINNCSAGFDLLTGGTTSATQSVGGEAIIDAVVSNTPIFVRSSNTSTDHLTGSLVIVNAKLSNVSVAVGATNLSEPVLNGTSESGSMNISAWGQGNVYKGSSTEFKYTQDSIEIPQISASLLDSHGRIVSKGCPQYEDYSLDQIVSAKDYGAKGDGQTDDTKALQALFTKCAKNKIIFMDAGVYLITSTLVVPEGSRIVGEAWTTISATGSYFSDPENPQVAVRIGEKGSKGVVEISDILFSTKGPVPGAIMVEWNVGDPEDAPASAGLWDTHFRIGGAAGTEMELGECPAKSSNVTACTAISLCLHITEFATAYLESTWVWVADHVLDQDGSSQLEIYAGRGVLSESQGPVWMIGTAAEHHAIYQYRLSGAKDHYLGLIQSDPAAPYPFTLDAKYADPTFPKDLTSAWAFSVENSKDIVVFGAGFYSFANSFNQSCAGSGACQTQIVDIDSESDIQMYSVSTVGVQHPISVDHTGIAEQQDNLNGFQDTVSVWTSS